MAGGVGTLVDKWVDGSMVGFVAVFGRLGGGLLGWLIYRFFILVLCYIAGLLACWFEDFLVYWCVCVFGYWCIDVLMYWCIDAFMY